LLGQGDWYFENPLSFTVLDFPNCVKVGDFNQDNNLDIVTSSGMNCISLLLGNGDGTFLSAQNYGTGRYPLSLTVADFDHDKKPDVATADFHDGTVSLLENIYTKKYKPQKTFCKFE
jgi:hypothetical protein